MHQVCATYADGFRATAVCPVGGPFASLKATKTGEALFKRYAKCHVMSCHVMFTSKMYYMIWYPFQTQISCVHVSFVFSKCCDNVVEFS